MPRRRLPARLYLRRARGDRSSVWVIIDGAKEIGTGAGADDRAGAEAALQAYLARSHRPPRGANRPDELLIAEVMSAYLTEHAPTTASPVWIADMAGDILKWWGEMPLSAINGRACRAYVEWRTAQAVANNKRRKVSITTARHELAILRAAIRHYHREHGPLSAVPMVTLPPKAPPREDYFWSRSDAARRIRAARSSPRTAHLVRLILLGIYSGTRLGAMLKLRWLPSTSGGWIDVEGGIIHRRPHSAARTKKRQPPARIHKRLLPHLRRWKEEDTARGISHVIHYAGKPVTFVYGSWRALHKLAGCERKDTPHIMRHTSATWLMNAGIDVARVAGYLGMSVDVLMGVYGHHHPQFQEDVAQATPKKQTNRK